MNFDTDVLIVGAGPTGLMMACQLLRFGIPFRIIDKQADRAHESRAFAIQAKSMEIFQNLGLVSEFLKKAESDPVVHFFVNGKQKAVFTFGKIPIADTPFPSVYFLPQSETEKILIEFLEKNNIKIERQVNLTTFSQLGDGIKTTVENLTTQKTEDINCRYIVGCDGAHSTVRHILDVPFEGAAYQQEFVLADASVKWSFSPSYKFMVFFDKAGVFLYLPLGKNLNRIMTTKFSDQKENNNPVTAEEIKNFSEEITHTSLKLSNVVWMSRFHLHHRAVKTYQVDRAFLAGDAAHIHSPVGGQGMNTGLQDATNLAWKLALVIKKNSTKNLLNTYQLERHRVGQVLVKTTDRIFGFLTTKNFMLLALRQFMLLFIVPLINYFPKIQKNIFLFISQLAIHYHENEFVQEDTAGADSKFLAGPRTGCRAPDAPIANDQTLFELFKKTPFNILVFGNAKELSLNKLDPNWFSIHQFAKSPTTQILFDHYGISNAGSYFIRPDGYIGFRAYGPEIDSLLNYLGRISPEALRI